MKLIVGLGNIGIEYQGTRHNFGFTALNNYINSKSTGKDWKSAPKLKAEMAKIGDTIFIKPGTFYNESGQAVRATIDYYGIDCKDILVIHDEIDLQFGQIRTRIGGASAGNNGIKNIIQHIGKDFARVRIGSGIAIGQNGNTRPTGSMQRDYVLHRLPAQQEAQLQSGLEVVNQIIDSWIKGQFKTTTYNFLDKTQLN